MYDYSEIEYEPTKVDELIARISEELLGMAKNNLKLNVKALQMENERLTKNYKIVRGKLNDLKSRESELAKKEIALAKKAAWMPLKEFFGQREVIMWKARHKLQPRLEKCDKCDSNRYRHYKTPLGRDATEKCDCGVLSYKYEPDEMIVVELRKDKTRLLMWFKSCNDKDDSYSSGELIKDENIYNGSVGFGMLPKYNTYFADEAQCQEYCDWLNADNMELQNA